VSAREDAAGVLTAAATLLGAATVSAPPGPWSIGLGLAAGLAEGVAKLLAAPAGPAGHVARVSTSAALLEAAAREQIERRKRQAAADDLYAAAERER